MKVTMNREESQSIELAALSLALLERLNVSTVNRTWSVILGRIMPLMRNGKAERRLVEIWAYSNPDFDCAVERLCDAVNWLSNYCDFLQTALMYNEIYGTPAEAERKYAYLWEMR